MAFKRAEDEQPLQASQQTKTSNSVCYVCVCVLLCCACGGRAGEGTGFTSAFCCCAPQMMLPRMAYLPFAAETLSNALGIDQLDFDTQDGASQSTLNPKCVC